MMIDQPAFYTKPSIRFEFRKSRSTANYTLGNADTKPTYDGTIMVVFTSNKRTYGPYSTEIKTFRHVWEGRKATRVHAESRALTERLSAYQASLEAAYELLLKNQRPVDWKTILMAMNYPDQVGTMISLPEVYAEFMAAKKAVVVADQSRRQLEQISPATFETYPKRWEMLYGYLVRLKHIKAPVQSIRYAFATNLKEWLYQQRKPDGEPYKVATINKVISLLKMLMAYALSKGYIEHNPVGDFSCRGSSPANPKPLTKAQLDHLETCELPHLLRHICDSWLVAGELCLHYADFMQLRRIKLVKVQDIQFIQHPRSKQVGSNLIQTVNVTERASRLLAKWGGPSGLYYKHSAQFSKYLKEIAKHADLRDGDGELIGLQFGQGRDSVLTQRAIDGANGIQLSKIAGWSKPAYAERYVGNPLEVVAGFVKSIPKETKPEPGPDHSQPFLHIHKAS